MAEDIRPAVYAKYRMGWGYRRTVDWGRVGVSRVLGKGKRGDEE